MYNRERLQLVFRSAVEQQSDAPCPPLADAWPLVEPAFTPAKRRLASEKNARCVGWGAYVPLG